jgi:DNA-binding MarR family transcriptional regulator
LTVNFIVDNLGAVTEAQAGELSAAPLPVLLRFARAAYGAAIRSALADLGLDDVPRNGIYVIGAIARNGTPLGQIIQELGVSKQAAGQLVDTLVLRGYLERAVDPDDRRRLTVTWCARGMAAAVATREAIARIEAKLDERAGRAAIAQTRATLVALIEVSHGESESD